MMKDQPATSLLSGLQGALPGTVIISRPGDVGSQPASVNIRGRGNISASSPLYVIDGVVASSNDFYRINPRDIENVSVLKDGAAAIYGNRAAFGVILVTTKQGASGRMTVNYDMSYAFQSPTDLPDFVGSVDYMMLRNEAARNAGTAEPFKKEQIDMAASGQYPDMYPNNNWYDLVYQKMAPVQDHNLNFSGGMGGLRFFVSGGYLDQESLLPTKGMKRYSFRTNLNAKLSNKFAMRTNLSFTREDVKNSGGEIDLAQLARMVPTMVAIQSDGNYGSINAGTIDTSLSSNNPLRLNREGGQRSNENNRFTGLFGMNYKPIPHITVDGQLSYRSVTTSNGIFNARIPEIINFNTKAPLSGTATNSPNSYSENWTKYYNLASQLTADYENTFADKHYFKFQVGTTYEKQNDRYLSARRTDYVLDNLLSIDGGNNAPGNVFNNGGLNSVDEIINSYFARTNYTFDKRFILDAIIRADASSRFNPDNRWGYFPSAMLAWVVSNESFMDSTPFSNFKLRFSYGKLGNASNVGMYDYFERLSKSSGATLNQNVTSAIFPGKYINQEFSWEVATNRNLGIDLGFLRNKLSLSVDVYQRTTDNILMDRPLPDEFGATSAQYPSYNVAKVDNKGIEAQIGFQGGKGDFTYFINGNFTANKNKILSMQGDRQISGFWITQEGGSVGDFYGYKTAGLLTKEDIANKYPVFSAASKPGDIKYVDLNNDGKIDGNDRTVIGNDVPSILYGISAGFNYKNFDFAINGQGVSDVKVYLENEASQALFNGAGAKRYVLDNRWTLDNPNPNAKYPRVLVTNTQNTAYSDFWLFNADYFRIKNVSVGYTLPDSLMDNLKINKLRLYVSLQNYFTFRGDKLMKDFDPEFASSRASYPNLKTITFGLNTTF